MNDDAATAAAAPTGTMTTERHVISTGLFRARARRVHFSEEPVPEPPPREPSTYHTAGI